LPTAEQPGQFPFTRGIYPGMYRDRLWTMRQYAGFGTAEESNARYRFLLSQGITGLSVAFDLPTQMGMDSDHRLAAGEVGRTGVAIDSLADMQALFEGIPLSEVSTSMTINSTAAILLCFYVLVADSQGADRKKLSGTVQNDILKEYIARGTYIYPPRPAMRIITDLFAWAGSELPEWNTISISGYHIREAGSTATQEVAFTLANAIAYIEAAIQAGLEVDSFAPRLSFFFNAHNDFFEEIAKFRAARRLYACLMRERFGAKLDRSLMLRFHAQTGGSTLTAQQPEVNVVRVALQAMAAVLGGTQSLHTNGQDEALSLPSEKSAAIALRTQQVIAYESGATREPDPLGRYAQLRRVVVPDRQVKRPGRLQRPVHRRHPVVRELQVIVRLLLVVVPVIQVPDVERRVRENQIHPPRLLVVQELVRPSDHLPQALLAFRPLQHAEAVGDEALLQVGRRERDHARRGQLDRERESVEPAADLGHDRRGRDVVEPEAGVDRACPFDEQRNGRRRRAAVEREREHGHHALTGAAQTLA